MSSISSGSGKVTVQVAIVGTVVSTAVSRTAAWNETVWCDASGGALTITLPTPENNGYQVIVKKTDSSLNTVTIVPPAGGTIDGVASSVISTQNTSRNFRSDGANYGVS